MNNTPSDDGLQGEGDHAAARRFRVAEVAFVKGGKPPEEALDDRLKESFPASDPPSASPGSD
jgi:hypothetical protein